MQVQVQVLVLALALPSFLGRYLRSRGVSLESKAGALVINVDQC